MGIKKQIFQILISIMVISLTTITYAFLSDLKVNTSDTLGTNLWNNLVDYGVPSGAVMSFNSDICPTGWSEYLPLRGNFIRGSDIGDNNDPDFVTRTGGTGTRKIGSTQDYELKSHNHSYIRSNGRLAVYLAGSYGNPFYYEYNESNGATGGNETRPTNVYLLYCKKS